MPKGEWVKHSPHLREESYNINGEVEGYITGYRSSDLYVAKVYPPEDPSIVAQRETLKIYKLGIYGYDEAKKVVEEYWEDKTPLRA